MDNVEKCEQALSVRYEYVYKVVEKEIWEINRSVSHEFCRLLSEFVEFLH